MKRILDNEQFTPEIDESNINKLISIIRYAVCGFIIVLFLKNGIRSILKQEIYSPQGVAFIIGSILGISIFGWFIYYNITHANLEKNNKYVIPKFRRPFTIIFLIYGITLTFLYVGKVLSRIIDSNINFTTISLIIIVIGLMIIIWREAIYLKRTSPHMRKFTS